MILRNFFLLFVLAFGFINTSMETVFAQLPNSNMTLLANRNNHAPTSGNRYSALWGYTAPNNRQYAIVGCYNGVAFYDVTDSANIYEADFHPGGTTGWREMKTYSHYAYIVTDVSAGVGLTIIDLQYLPDSVRFVRNWTFSGFTLGHTISQDGPYLYINGGNASTGGGIRIVDLTSNPELPVLRGQWITEYIHDSRVLRDTIWGANIYDAGNGGTGSIYVINATNKDNPVTINSWVNNPTPGPHNIAITGDRRFALTTDEIPQGSLPRQLKIWNIQNLSNVTLAATWRPTGVGDSSIVHNVEIYGNYALIAHYTCGIRLVNITNPAAPVEVAWYDTYPANNRHTYNGCWGVYMFPNGKIIGSDMSTGLYVLKPTVPLVGFTEPSANTPNSFELKQNYPNPFNPSTTIEFSLKKATFVTLKVYDALGRQVGLLADEFRNAGSYSLTYDAGRLSSGVYYYKLSTSDGFSETKKMILTK